MTISLSEQESFHLFIEASLRPTVLFTGKEMVIRSVNDAMLDVWGKDRSVVGKRLKDAMPELNGQPFSALLDNVYNTGEPCQIQEGKAEFIKDGKSTTLYFTFNYTPLKNVDGQTEAIVNTAADITELVLARQQIAETREQLEFALFSAEIGTWDLDPIHNIVKWDGRCRELFGFPTEGEILYEQVLSCIHPEDEMLVRHAVLKAIDPLNDGLYDVKYRTVSQLEGKLRWVHCKGKAYFNADSIAFRFSGTAEDITQEVAARTREQQLLNLVERNANHMTIATIDGKMVYMNHASKELLGVAENEDVTTFSARDFYSAEELERVQNKVVKEITKNGEWRGIVNLRHRITLETIPAHVSYILVTDAETGDIIGRGATVRDLRPELKAQKELADKNIELTNAVKELEFLANSVPSVVWTSTPGGSLDFINNRWLEHGALPMEETLGIGWAKTLHPDDMPVAWAAWSNSLSTGNPYKIEFRLMDKTGEYRWWLVRALPLKNDNGEIIKWYGTNTDITDQKELERQKDNFLGIASHELKTPITSIKAYVQVMEMLFKRSGDSKNAELLGKLDRQVNRLNSLVEDLLDVTKINTGRLQFNYETFDFNRMVEDVTEEVQRTTTKHLIRKQLQFQRTLTGDRDRICQVVMNLLTNAIKYSPDANEIVIYTEDHDSTVQLCVQDFGIGISKDKKDKVFEQFYRVSGTKQYTFPGLGLGLYISSEIVKRLDGRIWVNSTEGKGSTFCFTLPVDQKEQIN